MTPKICFITLSAYPLLSGKNLRHIIGPDVHTVLLARELVKREFEVSFITYDEGGPPVEDINGIEVIKTYRLKDIPHLNPVSKAFLIWKAMRKAKAHIYYHHSGASGVTSPFCRLMRKKFVYNIASDGDVSRQAKGLKLVDRFGCWLDIKLADAIIAQSEFQRAMLKKNFGKDGVLIKPHFPLSKRGMPEKAMPPIVLWVGAIADVKQPELFLKLAEVIPQAMFQMIAAMGDSDDHYRKIEETSESIPNLSFLGFIPFDEINQYFEAASILVNTSKFEGFPNAFIQAWMNYTPIVSLNSDPDEIICRYKLGFHSKTFNQMVEDVRTLLENEQLRQQMGENGRQYVEENHDINHIIKQYIEVFSQLVKFEGGRK